MCCPAQWKSVGEGCPHRYPQRFSPSFGTTLAKKGRATLIHVKMPLHRTHAHAPTPRSQERDGLPAYILSPRRRRTADMISVGGVVVMCFQSRCGENVPGGNEHGCDHGPDNKPIESEGRDSAKRGDQHNEVGHLGVFADEDRT